MPAKIIDFTAPYKRKTDIQFAYFKKGDKYNIVFLRENEMKIDQLLKQFQKKN